MFYLLYLHMDPHQHYVPFLNLMRYLTFRTGLALFTAQIVVGLMGERFIGWMRAKQGRGQPIRADGIARHITEKAGTPTMGGVMIMAGLLVGTLLWADLSSVYVWAVLLGDGGVWPARLLGRLRQGDQAELRRGFRAAFVSTLEVLIALIAVYVIVRYGDPHHAGRCIDTSIAFPVFKKLLAESRLVLPGLRRLHHRGRGQRGELHRWARRAGDGAGDDRGSGVRPDRLPRRQHQVRRVSRPALCAGRWARWRCSAGP